MRICLRLLGLDLLDLTIETDAPASDDDAPGDSMTNALGFTLPEAPPHEVTMPAWR